MFYIGCHLSCAKGYLPMVKEAEKIGATAFQFFTRNPRGGNAKALDDADLEAFLRKKEELGIGSLVAHAPYTLNGCSADESVRDFAWRTMREDLERLGKIRTVAERNGLVPAEIYYNFHPGSHVKQGTEVGIRLISEMLNGILTPELRTTVLLETMAGKGSEVGGTFEELREIIDRVEFSDKVGVCLDTCHVWDGGYDIVYDLDGVLNEFDRVIGLKRLKAIHLNDSLNVKGARKDRHAKIGEGQIGLDAMVRIINHPSLRHLPFCLETPNELDGYAREIALLRSKREVEKKCQ
ncbi:MAG: deoxyribonuclease IV [Lachnoclostridium sp.]|nr:deoxyribonuclease IV [Lachnoclostridium sp.]